MTFPVLIATVIMALSPGVPSSRAEYFGKAIAGVVDGNIDAAAKMIVTGKRESSWSWGVETCKVPGIGGLGSFSLGPGWGNSRCGPIAEQSRMAFQALGGSSPVEDPAKVFASFIGATKRHPEAKRRAGLYWIAREELSCRCSI